jgi:hypothetical protein
MDIKYASRFEFGFIPDIFAPQCGTDAQSGTKLYRDLSSHEFLNAEKMWLCEEIVQDHMLLITGDIAVLSSKYNIQRKVIKEWLKCYNVSHPFAKNQLNILAKQFQIPQVVRHIDNIAQKERLINYQGVRIRSGSHSLFENPMWSCEF